MPMLATGWWLTIEPVITFAALTAAGVVIYATKGINRTRIDGLEGGLTVSNSNVEALKNAMQIQHEECAQRIAGLEAQVAHALSEAQAARSEVVKAVTNAATEAVRAENRQAMAQASKVLADGQGVIIGHLEEIKATIGGKP